MYNLYNLLCFNLQEGAYIKNGLLLQILIFLPCLLDWCNPVEVNLQDNVTILCTDLGYLHILTHIVITPPRYANEGRSIEVNTSQVYGHCF